MSEENAFLELIDRVRDGDQEAAAQLVQTYAPAVRRAVKVQLRDRRLRRQFDSMDVCQSVLGAFFVRAALGQFDLQTPTDLCNLLATMVRNKVRTRARRPAVTRQVDFGTPGAPDAESKLLDAQPSPSTQLANRDLLEMVRRQLSPDERALAEQRALGRTWQQLAQERGVSPEALRKQYTRALDRVSKQLGLEEASNE